MEKFDKLKQVLLMFIARVDEPEYARELATNWFEKISILYETKVKIEIRAKEMRQRGAPKGADEFEKAFMEHYDLVIDEVYRNAQVHIPAQYFYFVERQERVRGMLKNIEAGRDPRSGIEQPGSHTGADASST